MKDPFRRENLDSIDHAGVYRTYSDWPKLALAGLKAPLDLRQRDFRKVYVLGMGGSAAAGDLLASWLLYRHGIETEVCKGVIPARDMSGCLALACSASGETQETISMMKTAVRLGATLVSTSHGGSLASESTARGIPHVQMPEIVAPRYMLPFMVFSGLRIFDESLGLEAVKEARNAILEMKRLGNSIVPSVPLAKNPSKKLALRLLDKTPAVYGTRATRGVGIRFKNEMNENGKKHAIYEEMPELFHNEIEAWEDPGPDFVPVLVRDLVEGKRDSILADAFARLLSSKGADPVEVRGNGATLLARLVTMTYLLDFASYYVALAKGQDPFPTPLITRLKKET
jgi:bifunctional phosphoglucose/phosphomannose isomerase